MAEHISPEADAHLVSDVPSSKLEMALEAASVLGIAAGFAMLVLYWTDLPDAIPRHFNASGRPDAWTDSKGTLLILPLVALALYAGLTVCVRVLCRISPQAKAIQDPVRSYRMARSAIAWLKVEIVWVFAYIEWQTIQVSLGNAEGLGAAFMPVFLIVVLGTVGIFTYKATRAGSGEEA